MKLIFTLTKEEYAKGSLPLVSRKTYLVVGMFLIISATLSGAIDDYYVDAPHWPLKFLIFLLVSSASYLLFIYVSKWAVRRLLYKSYKKSKFFIHPMTFEFSEKGVDVDHAVGQGYLQWEAYDKYTWSKDLCILYLSGGLRQILPLRILNTTEKEAFKQLLSQYINTEAEDKTVSK